MDIKDIIKWFIPCFLVIFCRFGKSDNRDFKLSLFLVLFIITRCAALDERTIGVQEAFVKDVNDMLNGWTQDVENMTKAVSDYNKRNIVDLSDYFPYNMTEDLTSGDERILTTTDVSARTFGRPLKKLSMALIPLAFQGGVAATWMFVSALLSLKGVLIGAAILKLLLLAAAAKIGTLFAHKAPPAHHQPWSPNKEVHLHIHNAQPHETHSHSYEEHGSPTWSRDSTGAILVGGAAPTAPHETFSSPYAGPQTINTPYGSYVRVGPPPSSLGSLRRR